MMKMKLTSLAAACSLAILTLPVRAADHPAAEPIKAVRDSARIVQQMKTDPEMREVLNESRGVLVIPDYAAAALIAGGSGGEGVLLNHRNGTWSAPVFYNMGKVSVGLQAGVSVGAVAFVLMSDTAVNSFRGNNTVSLTADAGLSLANWSNKAEGSVGKGHDVIVWTDTEGALVKLSAGVSDITWDADETRAYYGKSTTPEQILNGKVENPHGNALKNALAKS